MEHLIKRIKKRAGGRKRFFSFFCMLLISTFVFAQQEITGKVMDEQNEPLIGVSVAVKGTKLGTITAMDGSFRLSHTETNPTLVISYVGYHTKEIEVKNQKNIYVTLEVDTKLLDEIIVVGYSTQKKVNLTGSVQNVDSKDLIKRNASNTSSALQGLVPGMSVVQGSGKPGADAASIKIRGTGSMNSSTSPLVIIDGVEGDMNYLDMNSIESISVLKDAASASIYGSRASNGVILITTKRGKDEKLKVSYSGYAGFNKPTNIPKPVNALEYMKAINHASANAKGNVIFQPELIEEYETLGADNFNRYDTDWRKEIIDDYALTHNNSVSISGASKAIRYFANAGYYYQDGNVANDDFNRATLRVNTDFTLTKWMEGGLDINIRKSKSKQPSIAGPETLINKATTFVPTFSGINNDGTWGYGQNGDNPIAIAEEGGVSRSVTPELGIKGSLRITPVQGWEISTNYYTNRRETQTSTFIRPYDTYETGEYKMTYPTDGAKRSEGWSKVQYHQYNLQTSYERDIYDHYFKVLGGIQAEERIIKSFNTSRKGFDFPGYEELNHGDPNQTDNSGNRNEWAMFSYYTRLNYNFKERYLVELNGRWDGVSRFAKGNRWGFFPSVSAGWRISEEDFFQDIKGTVDQLKIRTSYGTLGNQEISAGGSPYYPYAALVATGGNYWFDKVLTGGVAQIEVANRDISWEKSTQFNIGLDASFLNSRLNLSGDYFIRNIKDMLQRLPIPMFVGLNAGWQNVGKMENRGWEFTASWQDKIQDFSYSITANLSDVKNKVTDLQGKEYINEGNGSIIREGHPINSWYGYLSDGFFQSQEEIDQSPVYGNRESITPGYIKYKDVSGPEGEPDKVVNSSDRVIYGDPAPRYEYSLNFTGEWKGIDLSLFFQGVGKKDIFYYGYGARPFLVGRSIFEHQLDTWTEENRNAKYPILLIDGSNNNPNNIHSDFWMKKGSFLRLKNIVLGYTLPKEFTKKAGLERARVYVSGQNLFTLTNAYKGFDPEVSVSGGSFYPLMKLFTVGVNIDF